MLPTRSTNSRKGRTDLAIVTNRRLLDNAKANSSSWPVWQWQNTQQTPKSNQEHAFNCSVSSGNATHYTHTHTHTQPFNGLWSGTTRVGWYPKKHSPTHPSCSSDIPYQLPPSTTICSILLVQFTCLTVLFHKLSPGPLWSGALYFIAYSMHFFTSWTTGNTRLERLSW